jgi:hypothetical protein
MCRGLIYLIFNDLTVLLFLLHAKRTEVKVYYTILPLHFEFPRSLRATSPGKEKLEVEGKEGKEAAEVMGEQGKLTLFTLAGASIVLCQVQYRKPL